MNLKLFASKSVKFQKAGLFSYFQSHIEALHIIEQSPLFTYDVRLGLSRSSIFLVESSSDSILSVQSQLDWNVTRCSDQQSVNLGQDTNQLVLYLQS